MDTGIPLFFSEIEYLLLETIPLETIMRVPVVPDENGRVTVSFMTSIEACWKGSTLWSSKISDSETQESLCSSGQPSVTMVDNFLPKSFSVSLMEGRRARLVTTWEQLASSSCFRLD